MSASRQGPAVVVLPTYNERENLPAVLHRLLDAGRARPAGPGRGRRLARRDGSPRRRAGRRERWSGRGAAPAGEGRPRPGVRRGHAPGARSGRLGGDPDGRRLLPSGRGDPDDGRGGDGRPGRCRRRVPLRAGRLHGPGMAPASSRAFPGSELLRRSPARLDVRDATSGFKAWRAESLRRSTWCPSRAQGYAFQIEMAHRCRQLGLVVEEDPDPLLRPHERPVEDEPRRPAGSGPAAVDAAPAPVPAAVAYDSRVREAVAAERRAVTSVRTAPSSPPAKRAAQRTRLPAAVPARRRSNWPSSCSRWPPASR